MNAGMNVGTYVMKLREIERLLASGSSRGKIRGRGCICRKMP